MKFWTERTPRSSRMEDLIFFRSFSNPMTFRKESKERLPRVYKMPLHLIKVMKKITIERMRKRGRERVGKRKERERERDKEIR